MTFSFRSSEFLNAKLLHDLTCLILTASVNFSVFYCGFSDDATSVTSGRLEHEESTKTEFNMQYSITPVNHLRMSADVAKLPGYVFCVNSSRAWPLFGCILKVCCSHSPFPIVSGFAQQTSGALLCRTLMLTTSFLLRLRVHFKAVLTSAMQ